MTREFIVRQEGFEGPLALLLRLIEEQKLPINSVSLAAITDAYITHTKELERFSLSQSADFVFIASSLLLIKSKSLLPSIELTAEEEGSIEELERRLKLYKMFRDLGRSLREIFGKTPLFSLAPREREPVFSPGKESDIARISETIRQVVDLLPVPESGPDAIIKRIVSLEEMIERLRARVEKTLSMSFKEFTENQRGERTEVIVSFLALLELVKEGLVAVEQSANFADITMEPDRVATPRYGSL